MFRSATMHKIAWVLCVALLALRIGGAHAHVHLHFDGTLPADGVHVHVHSGAGAHQESDESHGAHFELDVGVNAELSAKKPSGFLEVAAPVVLLALLLICSFRRTSVPQRRRRVPIRVLSVFAIRPLLRAPPL